MSTILNLKNRRCRNAEPHEAHSWRGLNTRGAGYYCVGRDPEYNEPEVGVRSPADTETKKSSGVGGLSDQETP